MAISGKLGMTKAMKRAARRAMAGNRKREKKEQRAKYHQEFQRKTNRRGYPEQRGKKWS